MRTFSSVNGTHSVPYLALNILAGHLPSKVRGLVEEWAELHQQELFVMWNTKGFHKITPLV